MADVMVVDDDDVAREIIRHMLEERGHRVDEAADGQAALAALEGGARPHCVVLDLMMPHVGGVDVLRRMRGDDRWRGIAVILMTALDEGQEVDQARACGFGRHFVKAYWHVGDLLQAIEHLTGDPAGRGLAESTANTN
jgi:CheY-like chemotaxis protein